MSVKRGDILEYIFQDDDFDGRNRDRFGGRNSLDTEDSWELLSVLPTFAVRRVTDWKLGGDQRHEQEEKKSQKTLDLFLGDSVDYSTIMETGNARSGQNKVLEVKIMTLDLDMTKQWTAGICRYFLTSGNGCFSGRANLRPRNKSCLYSYHSPYKHMSWNSLKHFCSCLPPICLVD